jgi:hypothetical protein
MAKWDTKDYGFGSSLNSPDYSGAFSSKKDGAFSNAWKTGFGVDENKSKNNWGEIFSGLFDKAKNTDKYRDEAQRPSFGESNRGSGGQLLENLSALYPQQHAPMFIPGQESSGGVGSAIGTLAGIGASFIPGMGPGIAKALPAIGGSIGSFF